MTVRQSALVLVLSAVILCATASPGHAAPHETGSFVRTAPKGATYTLIVPDSYDRKKGATLLFWLHGAGDNHANAARGLKSYGFKPDWILVIPNAQARGSWQMEEMERVMDVFETVCRAYTIRRSMIGGFSRGGFFTFGFGLNHTDKFAGYLCVAGGLPNAQLAKKEHADKVAVAIVHGDADRVVPYSSGTRARDAFQAAGWKEKLFFRKVPGLAHRFDKAAIQAALDWLDKTAVVFNVPKDYYEYAVLAYGRREPGRAWWALGQLDEATSGKERWWRKAVSLRKKVAATAEREGKKVKRAIDADRNAKWIPDWRAYDSAFEGTPFHAEVATAFAARVEAHNEAAAQHLAAAQAAKAEGDVKAAIVACLKIRDRCGVANGESVASAQAMLADFRAQPDVAKRHRRLLKGTEAWK